MLGNSLRNMKYKIIGLKQKKSNLQSHKDNFQNIPYQLKKRINRNIIKYDRKLDTDERVEITKYSYRILYIV